MICPDDEPEETPAVLQAQLRETADVLMTVMRERDEGREQMAKMREHLDSENKVWAAILAAHKAELHQEREANRPLRHELEQARESAGTLLAILEAVSDRLTAEEAASVAQVVAKAAAWKERLAGEVLDDLDDHGGQERGDAAPGDELPVGELALDLARLFLGRSHADGVIFQP